MTNLCVQRKHLELTDAIIWSCFSRVCGAHQAMTGCATVSRTTACSAGWIGCNSFTSANFSQLTVLSFHWMWNRQPLLSCTSIAASDCRQQQLQFGSVQWSTNNIVDFLHRHLRAWVLGNHICCTCSRASPSGKSATHEQEWMIRLLFDQAIQESFANT
jgi:hypothetical protein